MNPYEQPLWRCLPEGLARPGGLSLTDRLVALAGLSPGARVLDLGCGRGEAVAWLRDRGYAVCGVDHSPRLIAQGRERHPHVELYVSDAAAIPFPPASFEAVLLECALSLMPIPQALAECARVLAPPGLLLVTDLYSLEDGGSLSRATWLDRLEEAGFVCAAFEDHTPALREFAAYLVWETGSRAALGPLTGCQLPARPGYFALVAQRADCV